MYDSVLAWCVFFIYFSMSFVLRFSIVLSGCLIASFARVSASSFPDIPTWPGIQSSLNLLGNFCSRLRACEV